MPYADPEKQRTAERESKRRSRQRNGQQSVRRVATEAAADVELVLPEPPAKDELLKLLGVQARSGSVRAIELLLRMEGAGAGNAESDPLSALDDLAAKRAART